MGRPRTINKSKIIDMAASIVNSKGIGSLTFDELSKASGISKGGIQSCFGSKENLIKEMLLSSIKTYELSVEKIIGYSNYIEDRILAHLKVTFLDIEDSKRAAALMAAIFQNPGCMEIIRNWYRNTFDVIYNDPSLSRNLRLSLVSIEGAFFMRFFGLMQFTEHQWHAMYEDILTIIN